MKRSGQLYTFFVYVPIGFDLKRASDQLKRKRREALKRPKS